jgi:hypothetical protein
LALVVSAYDSGVTPTSNAPGAKTEAFSDDLQNQNDDRQNDGNQPKMAEVSSRPSPRNNKPGSIHTPLSLALRADAALHSISFVQEAQHPRSNPPNPCMSTLPGLVLPICLEIRSRAKNFL